MPDLDRELERFGRWLDTEIADRAAPEAPAEILAADRSRSRRLVIVAGAAAALVVAMLAVASRHATVRPDGASGLTADTAARVGPDPVVVDDPSVPASTSVTPGTATPDGDVYVVRTGDTLAGIARQLAVPYDDLVLANPGLDPTKFLVVGQRLHVPPATSGAGTTVPTPAAPYVLPTERAGFDVVVTPPAGFVVLPNVVLLGRSAGPDTWRDLVRVTATPDAAEPSAPPTANGFDGSGVCDCVVGIEHGVQLVVEGSIARDDALAVYGAVTVDGSASVTIAAPPSGFVEIARTAPRIRGASASLSRDSSTVTVETWATTVRTAVGGLPVRPAGVLTHAGERWRLVSTAQDVTVQSVVPGTATTIAVPVELASQRDALVASLAPVSAPVWSQLAGNTSAIYTVVEGDSLDAVLAKLGITLEGLLSANPRLDPSKPLVPGQRLRVPTG